MLLAESSLSIVRSVSCTCSASWCVLSGQNSSPHPCCRVSLASKASTMMIRFHGRASSLGITRASLLRERQRFQGSVFLLRARRGLKNKSSERRDDVRGEVSEETQKCSLCKLREDDEEPIISTDIISKPATSSPVSDIRGGVVALGKFDALHIGHRALAEQAARMGTPVLLSFSGMGDVLGWPPRLPVAAVSDRKRIMGIWAERCGGLIPHEYALDFSKVRSLSPQQFVAKLAIDLQVSGVVAGANYRFGYKAAGDASDLVHLCNEFGLQAFIVDPIMDSSEGDPSREDLSGLSREKGQVSSTRVRKALALGDLERVARLLGRRHRLVMSMQNARKKGDVIILPSKDALNQGPSEGRYDCIAVDTSESQDSIGTNDQQGLGVGLKHVVKVIIGRENTSISFVGTDLERWLQTSVLALEFV